MSNLTVQAIKTEFMKLLEQHPLTDITVRDIAEACGINRNTFYYHYHDIPELMEEIALDETNRLIESYADISSLEECAEAAFRFVVENHRSINHIYNSLDREVFERYLMKICEHTITTWFDKAYEDVPFDEAEREMKLRFIRYELFGACIDWMNEGMPEEVMDEAKQLLNICHGLINEEDYPILFQRSSPS